MMDSLCRRRKLGDLCIPCGDIVFQSEEEEAVIKQKEAKAAVDIQRYHISSNKHPGGHSNSQAL